MYRRHWSREYWIINKGSGFLAVVRFSSSLTHTPVIKLDRRHSERLRKRDNFLTGEGWKGGGLRCDDALVEYIKNRSSICLYARACMQMFESLCTCSWPPYKWNRHPSTTTVFLQDPYVGGRTLDQYASAWWHSSISLKHLHDPCAGGGTLLHLFGPPDPGNQFLLQDQEQCQQGDLIFTPYYSIPAK